MAETLFTVERTFHVYGRGLGLVGILAEQYCLVRKGDVAMIRRPDGSILRSAVCGVEFPPSLIWASERPTVLRYAIVVEADEVPLGSMVAIERAAYRPDLG